LKFDKVLEVVEVHVELTQNFIRLNAMVRVINDKT